MKKNKLIEALQKIEGNPDVLFWNGLVEDWMDISLVQSKLVKECKDFTRFRFEASWKQDNRVWEIPPEEQEKLNQQIDQAYKNEEWEFANPFASVEDEKLWYGKNRKKIILIDGKKRGKTTFDRLGDISY